MPMVVGPESTRAAALVAEICYAFEIEKAKQHRTVLLCE